MSGSHAPILLDDVVSRADVEISVDRRHRPAGWQVTDVGAVPGCLTLRVARLESQLIARGVCFKGDLLLPRELQNCASRTLVRGVGIEDAGFRDIADVAT